MRIPVKLSSSAFLSAAVFLILLAPAYFDASSFGPDTSSQHVAAAADTDPSDAGAQSAASSAEIDAYQRHKQYGR